MTRSTKASLMLATILTLAAATSDGQSGKPARRGAPSAAKATATAGGGVTVALPSSSPLVAIRLLFKAGSIHDPAGKEGLAALTAAMVADAGTEKRSYNDLLEALYPLAASIDGSVDREVTVFSGRVHRETLAAYTTLFEEALLHPAFAESDFRRNREQLLSELTTTLRASNDELLGLEAIQDVLFAGHPYGHPAIGTVQGLKSITLDDVRHFYRENYTRANLILGLAGGYPAEYRARLLSDLTALPAGVARRTELAPPPKVSGRTITLIEKGTDSVGIHFGYPLPITRKDPDFYALMVVNSALGEHRTFNGRLMIDLRGQRGLNYGDYSYVEYWARPPFTTYPSPGVPRHQQYFSVWVRPVVPADAHFALRAALWDVQRMHDQGLTAQEFEATRKFLLSYSKLWVQDLSRRLGFHLDSRYLGLHYWIDEIEQQLRRLTLADVNRAARTYLSTDAFQAVIVTSHAAALRDALLKDEPSPKTYNSKAAPEVLEQDKEITTLKIHPDTVKIVPVDQVFEK
jgi:zinc protease